MLISCHILQGQLSELCLPAMLKMRPFTYMATASLCLCSQWVSDPGKMKQHYRLSHAPDHQRFLQPASRLCSRFNTPGSPCNHCGATTKAPRQHPAKCTVLWQVSVMSLKLTEAGAIGEDGTASGSLRPPSGCLSTRDDTANGQKGSRNRNGPSEQEQGGSHGSRQGSPRFSGPSIQTTLVERWKQGTGNGIPLQAQQETAIKIL